MHRREYMAVAGRILKISSTFRRSVQGLGVSAGSAAYLAVSATTRALAAGDLPGAGDFETSFSPGRNRNPATTPSCDLDPDPPPDEPRSGLGRALNGRFRSG